MDLSLDANVISYTLLRAGMLGFRVTVTVHILDFQIHQSSTFQQNSRNTLAELFFKKNADSRTFRRSSTNKTVPRCVHISLTVGFEKYEVEAAKYSSHSEVHLNIRETEYVVMC